MAKKIVLSVEGMSCEHCSLAVREALMAVDGVKKAKVNLKKKNAEVTAEDNVDPAGLVETVNKTGYTASL